MLILNYLYYNAYRICINYETGWSGTPFFSSGVLVCLWAYGLLLSIIHAADKYFLCTGVDERWHFAIPVIIVLPLIVYYMRKHKSVIGYYAYLARTKPVYRINPYIPFVAYWIILILSLNYAE